MRRCPALPPPGPRAWQGQQRGTRNTLEPVSVLSGDVAGRPRRPLLHSPAQLRLGPGGAEGHPASQLQWADKRPRSRGTNTSHLPPGALSTIPRPSSTLVTYPPATCPHVQEVAPCKTPNSQSLLPHACLPTHHVGRAVFPRGTKRCRKAEGRLGMILDTATHILPTVPSAWTALSSH